MSRDPGPTPPTDGPPEVEALDPAAPLRRWVSRILRAGAVASGALLLVGVAAYAAAGGTGVLGEPARLGLRQIALAFDGPSPSGVLLIAVLVLALTPLTRVVLSAAVFARSGDRPMLAITAFVLTMLVLTILGGVAL
ncbi:MAG TPA: DUF1634 domain-containing protein [Thermoplasmata archaeon]